MHKLYWPQEKSCRSPFIFVQGYWFPTRRLAEKSAALEAVKQLDQAGELDSYLRPIAKVDNSDSDEDEEEEFSGAGEGVRVEAEKKNRLYRNKVWI